MSSLGYGMYGYSVTNPNGETDDLVECVLGNFVGASPGAIMQFSNVVSDSFNLAVPNSSGNQYSAIRTPVAGLYEVEWAIQCNGAGSAGGGAVSLYVDTQIVFDSSGNYLNGTTPNSYVPMTNYISVAASTAGLSTMRVPIFLERDKFLSIIGNTAAGTAPSWPAINFGYFKLRLVAAQNSGKNTVQI